MVSSCCPWAALNPAKGCQTTSLFPAVRHGIISIHIQQTVINLRPGKPFQNARCHPGMIQDSLTVKNVMSFFMSVEFPPSRNILAFRNQHEIYRYVAISSNSVGGDALKHVTNTHEMTSLNYSVNRSDCITGPTTLPFTRFITNPGVLSHCFCHFPINSSF